MDTVVKFKNTETQEYAFAITDRHMLEDIFMDMIDQKRASIARKKRVKRTKKAKKQ